MRKFRTAIILILIFENAFPSYAQRENKAAPKQYQRCATQEAIDRRYQTDPVFRAMMDQRERDFQRWRAEHPNGAGISPDVLTGLVTIPVVVHVVLPNPNIILESDVDYLINRLNLDFSGLNPDSTNGVNFYSVRGHSLLRWCLAKRDPSGNFTNGIERRAGAGTIGGGEPQSIKSFGAGGLNPWDVTKYYNIWIGVGGGLLGIAPEIGPGTAASDGVCINYQAFANNPCYTIGAFNLARTAVHEIGHNFGLYHTFQGGCANGDMAQLTSPGCSLPAPTLALPDDTPAQSASTSGCPSGNAASGCAGSPNPPGKQYQNYMDYTDDACYSMFTSTQVERMHWVLENCRAGYLTSNGCQLPAGTVSLDAAAIEIVSPGGSELVGCTVVTYNISGCSGTFAPKVRVQNRGTTTLTSVTVQLTLNGTPLPAQTFAVNIPYGKSTVVTLNNAILVSGSNTLSFATSAPNGGADGNTSNDAVAGNYTYTPPASTAIPITQDFVSATFPPTNFSVVNPNGNNTWVRNANGNGNAGSAFIDNYNFNLTGQTDDLRTILLTKSASADSVIIDFDYAHKNFPGLNDRLQVLVSSDCGSTFTSGTNPVFDRAGATLATAGSSTANYTTPAAGDWQHNRLAVFVGCGSAYTGGNIMVTFRCTNGYSNNIFIDNIGITEKIPVVFTAPTVTSPTCPGGTGSIVINTNPGPVYEYSVNNGATWQSSNTFTGLAAGSYNLAVRVQATPSCVYFYSGNPVVLNPAPPPAVSVPQSADFVSATFPPVNFSIINPNANNTWVRNANGNISAGSAFIDNYNFNLVGQTDELRTATLGIGSGADSVVIEFDYAHKNFPGFNDRLQVLVSSDCGTTFTSGTNPVFDRSGAVLATAGSSTASYTTPAATDWQHVRLAVYVGPGSPYVPGNVITATWRSTNGYGNNIFLDNINIHLNCINLTGLVVTQPSCLVTTGSIVVNATGAGTLEYSSNGGATYQTSNTFSNLTAGNYNVVVRLQGALACTTPYWSNPVVINPPPPIATLPASHDFVVAAPFLPTGWSVVNPNGNNTWVRNTNGNGNAGSAFIDNYNFNLVGQTDDIRTVAIARPGVNFINVGFDLAHKNFPGFNDRLQLLYSLDCGATFLATSFDRSGAALATAGSSTANYTTPASGDWVRQTVTINLCGATGAPIVLSWRATNGYGNNIFIDNISIDQAILQVNQPANQAVCNGSPTTAITFAGSGVAGTVYNWTNNTPSIGLAASGTGNIPSFNAINTGIAPVVATITVTPAAGACSGTPKTFTITVNPVITITCPANIVTTTSVGSCTVPVTYNPTIGGAPLSAFTYTFTGATTGTGSGSGSGSTFNIGVTTVSMTATNVCGTASCSFTITVNDGQLPVISIQPANRTICLGTSATFSVTATNAQSYQWQSWNGSTWVNITGANTASFTVNNASLAMNTNSYRVQVIGLCTTVTSGFATLYVNALPIVSIATSRPPQLLPTQTVTLTAVVSPGGGAYQWFKNNVAIVGATGNALNSLTVDDQGTYKVVYTDPNGCISTSADLVVSGVATNFVFIYPNPNDGLFHVRFYNANNETAVVSIFDAKGVLAFRKVVTTGNPYTDIVVDLAGRNASGVYIVEVRGDGGRLIGTKQLFINNGQ